MDQTMDYSTRSAGSSAAGMVMCVIYLAIAVLVIAGFWKTFSKAGEPGWAAIVPIYNLVILCKVAGKPWALIFLILIPLVGPLILYILLGLGVAQNFGKGAGYGIGLALLPMVFYPMLGFGDAKYSPVAA
jgi:hypothetical protein